MSEHVTIENRRRRWLVVVAPAMWIVAVVAALALQLFVCASGTDAAATPVRAAIVVVAGIGLALSLVAALSLRHDASWRPAGAAIAVVVVTAIGSVLLILVALLVPSAAIC